MHGMTHLAVLTHPFEVRLMRLRSRICNVQQIIRELVFTALGAVRFFYGLLLSAIRSVVGMQPFLRERKQQPHFTEARILRMQ